MAYLSDMYPAHVASVPAGNDLLRSTVGAGFVNSLSPLFSRPLSLSIPVIPIPFLPFQYVEKIRYRSKRARHICNLVKEDNRRFVRVAQKRSF
ncbi:hypothetical protein BKA67DRAFT_569135 [Truncatella angustata]|uniref:Uncharacterized protein n=1 Tax=Truncatella angustata TaxID=152316 RepID=A0A9P8UJ21_9PEZI|nr:uncharacterized protein BKA67DRAFT_569135 [Truncatella angustata]KAH6653303.1 hypothetical protein BKA67DRAFT_569135 [Truncatella angustata]